MEDAMSQIKSDEELFAELEQIANNIQEQDELEQLIDETLIELKSEDFMPIFDEYYGSSRVGQFEFPSEEQISAIPEYIKTKGGKKLLKDPKGGLTAAGRAFFKRTEGANLKPGVRGPADTPEKMRRKGSFLTRFFTNPRGPMKDEKGRATRLALSAAAWGEPVPKNMEDAAALAAKGKRLLERYQNSKKKSDELDDYEYKAALGMSIGQRAGGAAPTGTNPAAAVDHDSDGMIFDGTPQEQRKPYQRSSDANYEAQRRKFVRQQLKLQGIKMNRRVEDRSKEERDARARARGAFDRILRDENGKPVASGLPNTDTRPGPLKPKPTDKKPVDRLPSPPKKYPPGQKPSPSKPRDQKPADRYPDPSKKYPPGQKPSPSKPRDQKPADRYPSPGKKYPPGQKPSSRDTKPADRYPSPSRPAPGKPADRYPSPSKKYPPGQKPSARDVKPADRADRSAPNRRPDSADRASRSEYKPGYILEDADGQLQQYDGQPPKDKPYIREQRDGQLQQFGPPRRRGSGKRDF
jgi:hypothetical protein